MRQEEKISIGAGDKNLARDFPAEIHCEISLFRNSYKFSPFINIKALIIKTAKVYHDNTF